MKDSTIPEQSTESGTGSSGGINTPVALVTLSREGAEIIKKIAGGFDDADLFIHDIVTVDINATRFASISRLTASLFGTHRSIVYVAPCGVVVRVIAPHLNSKYTDPAVVVVDAGNRFAISLLSGHEGGANDLAVRVGNLIGAEPVITTTTEALKTLIIGIGCRRGASVEVIIEATREALVRIGAGPDEVRFLSSVDIKSDEKGLLQASEALDIPIRFISSAEIKETRKVFAKSDLSQKKVGLPAVAEPAALLAGKGTKLILKRIIWKGVTVAIARENSL